MVGVDVLVCRNDVGDLVSIWLVAADALTGSTARYESDVQVLARSRNYTSKLKLLVYISPYAELFAGIVLVATCLRRGDRQLVLMALASCHFSEIATVTPQLVPRILPLVDHFHTTCIHPSQQYHLDIWLPLQ